MTNAIILHGMPSEEEYFDERTKSPSNAHWLPWLQKKLLQFKVLTQTPEMPTPFLPEYDSWLNVFRSLEISENTILVGHSCGAGFLLKYITENNLNFRHLYLVAPYIDPFGEIGNNFFSGLFQNKVDDTKITIVHSLDDDSCIVESVNRIRKQCSGLRYVEFSNKGHFTENDLNCVEFPELFDIISKDL